MVLKDVRPDKSVAVPMCLERFSLSLGYDQPGTFGEREVTEKKRRKILNRRITLAVGREKCAPSVPTDWLIAVCHSNFGDTFIVTVAKNNNACLLIPVASPPVQWSVFTAVHCLFRFGTACITCHQDMRMVWSSMSSALIQGVADRQLARVPLGFQTTAY